MQHGHLVCSWLWAHGKVHGWPIWFGLDQRLHTEILCNFLKKCEVLKAGLASFTSFTEVWKAELWKLVYIQSSTPTLSAPLRDRAAKPRWRRGSGKPCKLLCFSGIPFSYYSRHPCVHTPACVSGLHHKPTQVYAPACKLILLNISLLHAYTTMKAMNKIGANRFSEIWLVSQNTSKCKVC